jgi:hypothetical protein
MIEPTSVAEQLFFVTARLRCRAGGRAWSGTGFFVHVPVANGDDQMVIVTNRHVLHKAEVVQIIGPAAASEPPPKLLLGQQATMLAEPPDFENHPDSDIDVAAMVVGDLPALGEYYPYVRCLPFQMLINEDALNRLDAIESITFIGYPNALYDKVNMTPIARRGWTATPISLDHNGKPCFLIDASVFKGSSGSPVFIVDRGGYTAKEGGFVLNSRFILAGIVAAVHLQAATGELVPTSALPGVTVNQPMNLGIVYKTRTIRETIEKLLSRMALTVDRDRKPKSMTEPLKPPENATMGP